MKNLLLATFLIGVLATATSHASFVEAVSCRGDCTPPTLGLTDNARRVVENGFVINDMAFNVESFSQTIPTQVFATGDKVTIQLTAYENSGTGNIRHVTLGIGQVENNKEAKVPVKITVERSFTGQVTQNVVDQAGFLKNVVITAKRIDAFTGSMTISFVVVKPFDTSDIIVRLWDAGSTSSINVFEDAIQVVGQKTTTSEPVTSDEKATTDTKKAVNPKEEKVKKKMEEQQKLKEEKVKKALEQGKKPYISEGKKKNQLPQQNYP